MTNLQLVQDANLQVVHEVYDLLSDENAASGSFILSNNGSGSEWLLIKPATTAPMRMLRFTQFKPIYKHGVINTNHTCTITITPHLLRFNNSDQKIEYEVTPTVDSHLGGYTLFSNSSTDPDKYLSIPIKERTTTFTYDGTFASLSHNINDQFDTYLYVDGSFYFYNYNSGSPFFYSNKPSTIISMAEDAFKPGYGMGVNESTGPASLISFNTDNLDEVQGGIKCAFVYTKLTHPDHTTYSYLLFWTFDIVCNTHAFSVHMGYLLKNITAVIVYYGQDLDDVVSYEGNMSDEELALTNNNMLISLCSSYAGNLTGKIFTGENIYQTVNIEVFPSSNYFPIQIRDKNNRPLTRDQLAIIYDQISVAVDYVYLTY